MDYNKKIILDLNGYMINYPNNYMSISGTLTIKDSNYYSTGKFIGLPGGALKGKLIIQSGKYSFDPYTYLDVGSTRETASGGYYTVTRKMCIRDRLWTLFTLWMSPTIYFRQFTVWPA